jgi:hypothetical protein
LPVLLDGLLSTLHLFIAGRRDMVEHGISRKL